MERKPSMSSNIQSVGYDAENEILEVEFHSQTGPGRVYQYTGVPKDVWRDWDAGGFRGSLFAKRIKPMYRCERIS